MALKLRKDIKKSSYYVWFLGAKESKGLRGSEYILPVIKHLEEREKDVEPFKVTLQVSHKGLKIVQNIVSQGQKNSKPKNETIKHFIPHNTITCVYQHDDIIACILLLFNPVTKCPLHVHAYRCDSLETATLLKNQLQTLIERPENQKKFAEIENRLKPQKEVKKVESSIGSDTGTSTRESESSEERFAVESTRVTTLYDSVAAELREKLGKKNSPILLPPRDYDTVHRTKGNLTGIELRRCLNANIVGQNVKGRRLESSGGSSGIGSDHPPSPDSPETPDSRFNTLDNQSTSDEDWNGDPAESTLYLMHQPTQMTLPRPHRDKSPEQVQRFSRYAEPQPKYEDDYRQTKSKRDETNKYLEKPIAKYSENKYLDRQKSLEREKQSVKEKNFERQKSFDHLERDRFSKTLERSDRYHDSESEKYYYQESRDKYDRYEKYPDNNSRKYEKDEFTFRRGEKEKPVKYFEDDGFDENIRYRSKSTEFDRERSHRFDYEDDYFEEKQRQHKEYPVPKTRQKYAGEDDSKYYKENSTKSRCIPDDPRYYTEPEVKPRSISKSSQGDKYEKTFSRGDRDRDRSERDSKSVRSQEYYEESTINRKNAQFRQRSPSPEDDVKAPRDRFKDAKEKFLLMERERLENERRRPEPPISPVRLKEKIQSYSKRQDGGYPKENSRSNFDDRYYEEHRRLEESRPTPAPRHIPEEIRYRERDQRSHERDVERYRHTDKFDPKRRSMFSLIEEEHRKNSNEIAKELKRRSYLEGNHFDDDVDKYDRDRDMRDRHFQELPESDRFLDNFSKSSIDLDKVGEMKYDQKFVKNQKLVKNSAGYRHSYAEPKLRMEKNGKKHFSEMLHRTNSSVSNNGRVGIASVHPY